MSRNPTRYALQELIGWEEFERLGTSILYGMGFKDIKSAGGVKDNGKDAAIYTGDGDTTVIQISQEKNPLKEVRPTTKKKTKFWREYNRWTGNKQIKKFVFLSNQDLGSKKTELIEKLEDPVVDIYSIDELVNFLDYDDAGKEIKKNYAIFDKDLHEVFGADDQNDKLNEVAEVISQDEHYNIHTLLAPPKVHPHIPGAVFSMQDGEVVKYFTPKSYDHYLQAVPTVSLKLSGKREEVERYMSAIRSGVRMQIPSSLVKDLKFKIGDKTFMDGTEGKATLHIGPVPDDKPRVFVLRSTKDSTVAVHSTLKVVDRTLEEAKLNNFDAKEPLDMEVRFTPNGELKLHYTFQLDRCRDAAVAFRYAQIFDAIQRETVELSIDDDGIERKIVEIPPRGGEPLSEGFTRALQDMARIQQFFKVRLPNLFSDQKLEENDRYSLRLLSEIIDKGKANINISNLSLVLLRSDTEKLREETAGEKAMALGGSHEMSLVSVLGVSDFPTIQLILPKAKIEVTDLGDGTSKLDIDPLEQAYLRHYEGESKPPSVSWS